MTNFVEIGIAKLYKPKKILNYSKKITKSKSLFPINQIRNNKPLQQLVYTDSYLQWNLYFKGSEEKVPCSNLLKGDYKWVEGVYGRIDTMNEMDLNDM